MLEMSNKQMDLLREQNAVELEKLNKRPAFDNLDI